MIITEMIAQLEVIKKEYGDLAIFGYVRNEQCLGHVKNFNIVTYADSENDFYVEIDCDPRY